MSRIFFLTDSFFELDKFLYFYCQAEIFVPESRQCGDFGYFILEIRLTDINGPS